jgi:hypothetical protein
MDVFFATRAHRSQRTTGPRLAAGSTKVCPAAQTLVSRVPATRGHLDVTTS